jgi:hypothetical protein
VDAGEEVGCQLVVASVQAAEVPEAAEHALDGVAVLVEDGAKAALPPPGVLGRDVGRSALALDELAHRVGVLGTVRQHDAALG